MKSSLYFRLVIFVFITSCGVFDSKDEDSVNTDKIYIALQGIDQVAIVNMETGNLENIPIDFDNSASHTPHFITVDEINEYWFVTTIASGWVGRFDLKTNTLIDKIFVSDSPALMAINEDNQKLYVSRMMPMGGMMMGGVSTVVQEIDYSQKDSMILSNEYSVSSPAPHGLAINSDGSEVYVASNTADWLWKIDPINQIVNGMIMDESIGNTPDIITQRLKPIQIVSVDDSLLFVSCSGGIWYNSTTQMQDTLSGMVQLWNSNSLTLIDTFQFSWNSTPWHIIQSPVKREIFVVLSGDVLYSGSAGLAAITFASNKLQLKWATYSDTFQTLHGIDISGNGENIYVSGRRDGHLHLFNGLTGEFQQSISLGNNPMAGGISVVSSP